MILILSANSLTAVYAQEAGSTSNHNDDNGGVDSNDSNEKTAPDSDANSTQSSQEYNSIDTAQQPVNSTADVANDQDVNSTSPSATDSQNANNTSTTIDNQMQNSTNTDSSNNTQTSVNDNVSLNDSLATTFNSPNQLLLDFVISIDSNSTNIKLGETRTYTVTVSSLNGFNSSVILNIPQSIPRVITAFSTSPIAVPANGSAISTLVIVADKYAPTGIYDLTINGTMTRMNGTIVSHSIIMKLELWQEPIMPLQSVPVANTTIQPEKTGINSTSLRYLDVQDLNETAYGNVTKQSMVMISTVVSNNNNKTQPFVVVIEVMDSQLITDYIQLQKGTLPPLGEAEIGISWVPALPGTYHVRSFVIDEIIHPEPLSNPVEKSIVVE